MAEVPHKFVKPLGIKAYGSICHLPGSRLGPGDHKLNPGQARILTAIPRDRHDVIIVQEKLDGSNVAVARVGGALVAIGRAGYPAISSKYEQHQLFAHWVNANLHRFEFLDEGERLCGEWLAQAHGTRYALTHEPFVPFDLMRGAERAPFEEFRRRVEP
ncbi:MAG: RNA ligase family protein, partial [Tepidisphaeraceae bacterium]